MIRSHVLICGGTGCTSSGSQKIREHLENELVAKGLSEEIKVVQTGCFGLCALGPIMIVYPEGTFYSRVTNEDVSEIVEEHLLKGRPVERLIYNEGAEAVAEEHGVSSLNDTNFYKAQKRVALRNCGVINPEVIEEYIARDGYMALAKVLTEMKPDDVINTLLASGLRGRGGAGFPTGMKWKFAKAYDDDQKYVCCNADEGDPAHSWIAASSKATRTPCLRLWRLPVTPSARTRAISMSARVSDRRSAPDDRNCPGP